MNGPEASPAVADAPIEAAAPVRRPQPAWTRHPVLRTVGSLKFAVVMIFGFAVVMVFGLYAEGARSTEWVQRHVYKAWWFNGMFLALAANIAGAALTRYPWPRRLTGFVITHLGLLVLIGGTLVTRLWGIEGKMILFEHERADRIVIRERLVLSVRLPDGTPVTADADELARRVGDTPRRLGRTAWALGVTEYLPRSERRLRYEPDPTGLGRPALRVTLRGANFPAQEAWLEPDSPNPSARGMEMPMLQIESRWLPDAAAEADWRSAADPTRRYRLRLVVGAEGEPDALVVTAPDGGETRVPATDAGATGALPDGATVTIERVLRNAVVRPDATGVYRLEDVPVDERGAGPAVQATLTWPGGQQAHTAFAAMPEFPTHRGHAALQDDRRALRVGVLPDGRVLGHLHDPEGRASGRLLELREGGAIETPWAGIRLVVERVLPAATRVVEVVPAAPRSPGAPAGHDQPAARLRFVGPGGEAATWVQLHDSGAAQHPAGHVHVRWSFDELPLGFTVQLLDFRKGNDPGTTSAASFESDVLVDDPVRGRHEKVRIHMNYPLLHGGPRWIPGLDWAFYQESYGREADGREWSQLQVAYDPGYPIVSIGAILIVGGIFTMFYLIPYFRPTRPGRPAAQGAKP